MPERDPAGPLVRVEDATLVPDGGAGRLVISRLERVQEVAEAAASAGAAVKVEDGRLRVVSTPSRLVDAAGRTGGAALAEPLRVAVDEAVAAWLAPPPDVVLTHGTLPCSQRTIVMGIVNATPDSFSDGGNHYDPAAHPQPAIEHAHELVEAGADIIDVGGESSRPGAEPVAEQEELSRVIPVVEALAGEGVAVSIDTTKSAVAKAAVEAGAVMVNDVSAGVLDGLLLQTVIELQVPYVVMHMQGTPRTMQRDPRYGDVVADVFDFLADHVMRLTHLGLPREKVVVDPGIGFGKTADHNLQLLQRIREFTSLGRPVLIGTSRKGFLGSILGVPEPRDRLIPSLVTAAQAVLAGAALVRVHDVVETVHAVRTAEAVRRGHVESEG